MNDNTMNENTMNETVCSRCRVMLRSVVAAGAAGHSCLCIVPRRQGKTEMASALACLYALADQPVNVALAAAHPGGRDALRRLVLDAFERSPRCTSVADLGGSPDTLSLSYLVPDYHGKPLGTVAVTAPAHLVELLDPERHGSRFNLLIMDDSLRECAGEALHRFILRGGRTVLFCSDSVYVSLPGHRCYVAERRGEADGRLMELEARQYVLQMTDLSDHDHYLKFRSENPGPFVDDDFVPAVKPLTGAADAVLGLTDAVDALWR